MYIRMILNVNVKILKKRKKKVITNSKNKFLNFFFLKNRKHLPKILMDLRSTYIQSLFYIYMFVYSYSIYYLRYIQNA